MRLFVENGLKSNFRQRFLPHLAPPSDGQSSCCSKVVVLIICALLTVSSAIQLAVPSTAVAQSGDESANGEVVADLAAGRVVIAVVKDAILVGALENPIEARTVPPTPVLLTSERFGVFLGPVDWWELPSDREIGELNQELPRLHSYAVATPPHLGNSNGGDQPLEIEITGESLHQRLNELAGTLHSPLNLPPNEPFAQLIVADYFSGYGPEIWQLSYAISQEQQQGDYWTTRIDNPTYLQFWPPEKGQPRTLVEFDYPSQGAPPSLLELLQKKDPRIERIVESDSAMRDVAQHFIDGTCNKLRAADATQFMRAALDALAPPQARETMGVLYPETGFRWILAPPPEMPVHRENRPPGAPTLQPQ